MTGVVDILSPSAEIYVPTKVWYVWVTDGGLIVKSIGSMFELSNVRSSDQGDRLRVVRLGQVNEEMWKILNKLCLKPYYFGILDEVTEEIYYYKFKASPLDEKSNSISFSLEDEHGADILDCQLDTLHVKKLRYVPGKGSHLNCILNQKPEEREFTLTSPSINVQITTPNKYTLRSSLQVNGAIGRIGNKREQIVNLERYITLDYE